MSLIVVLLNGIDNISKTEEQLGKSKIIDYDPTNLLTGKFQRLLWKLKKEDKFDKKTYSLIYPSDCIPPRLCGTLKAHKPDKNYPMRAVPINYRINTIWHFEILSKNNADCLK